MEIGPNKGYQHPYGNTVIPNAPTIVTGNGIQDGQGPSGGRSIIPGAIGVAGPKMRSADVVERPQASSSASSSNDDDLLGRLVDLVAKRVVGLLGPQINEALARLSEPSLPSSSPLNDPMNSQRFIGPSPPPVLAAPVAPPMTQPVGSAFVPLPSDKIEAYSRAHADAQKAVVGHVLKLSATGARVGVTVVRAAPEPPVLQLMTADTLTHELCIYSAAFDSDRYPVRGVPSGNYLVLLNGTRQEVNGVRSLTLAQIVDLVDTFLKTS